MSGMGGAKTVAKYAYASSNSGSRTSDEDESSEGEDSVEMTIDESYWSRGGASPIARTDWTKFSLAGAIDPSFALHNDNVDWEGFDLDPTFDPHDPHVGDLPRPWDCHLAHLIVDCALLDAIMPPMVEALSTESDKRTAWERKVGEMGGAVDWAREEVEVSEWTRLHMHTDPPPKHGLPTPWNVQFEHRLVDMCISQTLLDSVKRLMGDSSEKRIDEDNFRIAMIRHRAILKLQSQFRARQARKKVDYQRTSLFMKHAVMGFVEGVTMLFRGLPFEYKQNVRLADRDVRTRQMLLIEAWRKVLGKKSLSEDEMWDLPEKTVLKYRARVMECFERLEKQSAQELDKEDKIVRKGIKLNGLDRPAV